ncbi:CGNR zinc finger domain-containing protein [Fodinicola acaciae]|uniref:CGNR zinc finger domain-containing protein n=1 Tax=Fodinicola acaciae TaxID=2681555 RepID=UPI0013D0B8C1|nr:CGNR zinc finger domain-containing protein [Fodinicola acaciae]
MDFSHDTRTALTEATALVNTRLNGVDRLTDLTELGEFLARHRPRAHWARTDRELQAIRRIRGRFRALWEAADDLAAAEILNDLWRDARALPRLVRHTEGQWHVHATDEDAPLDRRIAAEDALAFADLIRFQELDRLRHCASDDCDAVLIDMSRNKSRRYCDTGNCGNRANVAAYRARKRG